MFASPCRGDLLACHSRAPAVIPAVVRRESSRTRVGAARTPPLRGLARLVLVLIVLSGMAVTLRAEQEEVPREVGIELRGLKQSDAGARARAAANLGGMGAKARAAVPALMEALKDSEGNVRWLAAAALGEIGPPAAAAVPALIEALKDSAAEVRKQVVVDLGKIGPPAAAVPALIEALKDSDEIVRAWAVVALGNIGPSAKAAVPVLIKALKDSKANVRQSAKKALQQIQRATRGTAFCGGVLPK